MKFSVVVPCHCGHQNKLEGSGTQDPKVNQCEKCGTVFWFVEPLGPFVGGRIFSRAWDELKGGDYTLTIVLSAMAVECELARLFFKWREIEARAANATGMPTQSDIDGWEVEWRSDNRIKARFDKVSILLTTENFDSFLSHNAALLAPVRAKYSTFAPVGTSPKSAFVEQFFHKRNKIVHSGEINFQQPDAELCFALADSLFQIMKAMDERRRKVLDDQIAAMRH